MLSSMFCTGHATIFYSSVYEEAGLLITATKIFFLGGTIFLHRIKVRKAAIFQAV